MNMNLTLIARAGLFTAALLAGCTQARTVNNGNPPRHSAAYYNEPRNRRMITGSNVPQPVNRPTFSPTSATIPLESAARDRPGLTPTEPIVGAGDQSLYRADEPSTGAGPAGSNPMPGRP